MTEHRDMSSDPIIKITPEGQFYWDFCGDQTHWNFDELDDDEHRDLGPASDYELARGEDPV